MAVLYQANRETFLTYGDEPPFHSDAFWRYEDAEILDELRERDYDHTPEYRFLLGEVSARRAAFDQQKAAHAARFDDRCAWLRAHPSRRA